MSNPFTARVWTAKSVYFVPDRLGGTDGAEWNDTGPILNATLLRTIATVHFMAYGLYSIGAEGIPNMAVGFGLGETSSVNYNLNPPVDDPEADYVDYLATGSDCLHWTALGFPPTVSGTLSGSINSIDSSGDIELSENLNTYMYGTATIRVDSKAQRRFTSSPAMNLKLWDFNGPYLLNFDRWAVAHFRFLWQQREA